MAAMFKEIENKTEKEIFDRIAEISVDEMKQLLCQPGVRVDGMDEQGSTFLQHAAFKGRKDLCELLLQNGADVNSNYHRDGYTALMFAGISGSAEVVLTLLRAGAKTFPANRVNKTAAEMASFVGNHNCVSVITNFVQLADVEYYAVVQGLEKQPKLPKNLVKPLQELLNKSYLHPVRLTYYIESCLDLLEESVKVTKVLRIMCEKSMKGADTNDVMAVKVNYFSFIIRTMAKSYNEKDKSLQPWLKSLVKGRESDGFMEKPERLIRQSMKEFPYAESELLLTFVRTIAPVEISKEPTALTVLTNCIHGRAVASAPVVCECCGEPGPPKKCSACKAVHYCDVRCQKLHYSNHKKFCAELGEELIERLKLQKLEDERLKAEEEKAEAERVKAEEEKAEAEKLITETAASSSPRLSNGSGDDVGLSIDKIDIKVSETTNGEQHTTQLTESS